MRMIHAKLAAAWSTWTESVQARTIDTAAWMTKCEMGELAKEASASCAAFGVESSKIVLQHGAPECVPDGVGGEPTPGGSFEPPPDYIMVTGNGGFVTCAELGYGTITDIRECNEAAAAQHKLLTEQADKYLS